MRERAATREFEADAPQQRIVERIGKAGGSVKDNGAERFYTAEESLGGTAVRAI